MKKTLGAFNIQDNDLSIYVSSCDKYSWLWPSFFYYFNKFWHDCPYKLYLGSETMKFDDKNVTTLNAGRDIPWGQMTRSNLEKIDTKYVLVMLDDFLLENYVDSKLIDAILHMTIQMNANHVRLNELGVKKKLKVHEIISSFTAVKSSNNITISAYIVSLQAAIWNRKFLLSILRDEESPWEFEIKGSERVQNVEKFYYLDKTPLFYHYGGIVNQGMMERKYARVLYRKHLLAERRNVMSRRDQLRKHINYSRNNLNRHLCSLIPPKIKQYVKNVKVQLRIDK